MHHTSEWIAFMARRGGMAPLYIEGTGEGGEIAAVAYIAHSARWPLSQWATCQTDALPIAPHVPSILLPFEELLRSRGCVDLSVGSFAAPGTVELAPHGYAETRRLEFVLRFDGGVDQAWKGFRMTQRNEMKKFAASGAECSAASDDASIESFCAIEEATLKRHHSRGKEHSRTSRQTLDLLWEIVVRKGRARVYFARKGGVAVSTAVVGVCGPRVYLIYSGSTPEGFAIHASKGLLWHVLNREYEAGMREFNLGGVPPGAAARDSVDHGLYRFKQGFGGEERVCISGRKMLRPVAARCREAASRLVRFLRERAWREPLQDVS